MGHLLRITAIVLLVGAGCGRGTLPAADPSPAMTTALESARDFTLSTFEGDTFTLSDHFGELPVVLNFWAPW